MFGGILFKQSRSIYLIILCAISVSACGYRFSGQGQFPEGVQHIFIEVFDNRTSKTGIERVVTNQVIFEFTRQRQNSLVDSAANADAVLKGTVRTIRTQTVARVGTEVASQREVVMILDLTLVRQNGGQILWAAKGVQDRQVYDVAQQSQLITSQSETDAIAVLSERISERVFNQLTNNF
jgi:outer membrane lipopolysaccharide assembly protein LptE/RlpB